MVWRVSQNGSCSAETAVEMHGTISACDETLLLLPNDNLSTAGIDITGIRRKSKAGLQPSLRLPETSQGVPCFSLARKHAALSRL